MVCFYREQNSKLYDSTAVGSGNSSAADESVVGYHLVLFPWLNLDFGEDRIVSCHNGRELCDTDALMRQHTCYSTASLKVFYFIF